MCGSGRSDIEHLRDVAIDGQAHGPVERGLDHEVGHAGLGVATLAPRAALGLADHGRVHANTAVEAAAAAITGLIGRVEQANAVGDGALFASIIGEVKA